MGMKGKAVKSSACWSWKPSQYLSNKGPKNNSVSVDSGCSRHMTGNISYLADFEPFDGGYVSFRQGGCKITRKGTIKTGKLEFENVYFVKDLKYNLFSVSQICDNKYSVLFTDSKCIVLGRDFKLLDDANILLRTPRTKDETSGILRKFITEIENLKDLKVKIIRCDNRGEFINKELNDFCLQKGIKREFSNARTPQQNGVAERRNRSLIKAARTMLADAKLLAHNKTPYELFDGRTPAIGFFKPFGCHVMIRNTLDNLGKFKAKGDEGYFLGYSISSKAFRIFNKRTKRVKEIMHIEFLENKAIEKCSGPNWLFDIDSLTKSMNYVTVVDAGTHSTNFPGTKVDASKDMKKDVSSLRYIILPNWGHKEHLESTSSQPQVETLIPTASSPVLTVSFTDSQEPLSETRLISKRVTNPAETSSLDNILTLTNQFEDIFGDTLNSEESNGVEADVSNMEITITASPTPTLKIHRDHPKSQIIGPVDTPIQTRNKSKEVGEQSFIAIIHQKTDTALLQFCLFSCFLSQVEPKKISDALQDPSWVLKNKKDERGIVIRNKARLVAQRHTQEEGIDYDEVFASVARIEAIRLFLAYALFMGFTVYQMDVKSAFLYGTIDEKVGTIDQTLFIIRQRGNFILVQVYVDDIIFGSSNLQLCKEFKALVHEKFQMSAMGELNFFLGLQVLQKEDVMFLSQDKYVGDILKKFGYSDVRSSNTPIDKENPWGKDGTGKDVDLHLYRSMIGSLMYLTASRPDIMFAICACARHQMTPKECHLHAVKRIFRYLKGHPKLGLLQFCDYHNMVAILEKSEQNADFHPILDFIEASPLRRNLKLQDEEGINSLPNTELFENLTLMGYNIYPNQKFTFQKGQFSHQWKFLIHTIMQCLSPKSTGFNEFSSNIATALVCLATNMTYNFSKMIFDGLVKSINNKVSKFLMYLRFLTMCLRMAQFVQITHTQKYVGEGSGTPTEPHHTPSQEAQPSSPTHLSTSSIPTVAQSEPTPLRQNTRRARIAQSSALPPVADEPASPMRDASEWEAFHTDSSFIADQDRATIAKSSTLPHDTAPRVTSSAAVEAQEVEINKLKERVKILEDNQGVIGARSADDAPIKGRRIDEEEGITGRVSTDTEEIRMDEGEVAVERTSGDTEEMATVLTSMDAATVLAGGIDVPTGSSSIPTVGPPAVDIHTGSDAVPTASPIVATATVVTPYSRRKGKEVMVKSDTPKKQRLQEQIDAQVARELEEQQESEDMFPLAVIPFPLLVPLLLTFTLAVMLFPL
nr:hypothetical protein [Tanacetum cinerariifolium]